MEKTFDLTITDYSKKGHGVAFVPSQDNQRILKVEVVGAVIGDKIEVALGKRRKQMYQGTLLRLIQKSPSRVTPRCSYTGICGGCSWQPFSYQAQLAWKEQQVRTLFASLPETTFHQIVPCHTPWEYRNKMEFSFSENKKGEKFLGLIMTHSRGKVLNLHKCYLMPDWVTKILQSVRIWWESRPLKAFHPPSGTGCLRTLTMREGKRTGKKMVFLTISGDHEHFIKRSDLEAFKEEILKILPDENPSLYLRIHRAVQGRPTTFYEMHLHGPVALEEQMSIREKNLHFQISPTSFFQPNTLQAEKLYERALALVNPDATMRVYDLYAGCGSLGMVFAPFVKKVIGIELCAYAVCDAEANLRKNNITNMRMIRGDVGEVLSDLHISADLAIVDPPRSGLDPQALSHLLRLDPKKILYLSCNPTTQVKNILSLIEHGYKLKDVQPVDQFPHTPHIENISFLEK